MKKILWLVLLLFLLAGCELFDTSRDVEYTAVCSSGTVDLTIENRDGGTSQFSDVPTPWSYSFTGEVDDFVYVSAQNNQDNGTVTVKIIVDGDTFKSSISSGAYVIASAYGSLE